MNGKFYKLFILASLLFFLIACSYQERENSPTELYLSNMASEESMEYVRESLESYFRKETVSQFIDMVSDYNDSVGGENLIGDFKRTTQPIYDVGKLLENRQKAETKYPFTNCRITTYLLLQEELRLPNTETFKAEDYILFMDQDSLKQLSLYRDGVYEDFVKMFGSIPTTSSKDPKEQGKVMEQYFSKFIFPPDVKMISVILHDNLDGNHLFIGHVGVLIPVQEGFLFLEKISFEEPYQAIIFPTKELCIDYLYEKYEHFIDPNVTPPFVMENGIYVKRPPN